MVRDIVEYPSLVLTTCAEPVTDFGPELEMLVQDMFETVLFEDRGMGLAAPQIGVGKRVIVVGGPHFGKLENGEELRLAMVNPSAVEVSDVETEEEGCLSLPGLRVDVPRPTKCRVIYLTPNREPKTIEAEGLLARAILHEIDHLNGRMIVDYLSSLKRKLALEKWSKNRKQHIRRARSHEKTFLNTGPAISLGGNSPSIGRIVLSPQQ